MEIKIFGPGCAKCVITEKVIREALAEAGIKADVKKISDINTMIEFGVMMTPAVAVDDVIIFQGSIPKKDEFIKALTLLTKNKR
ncbi:MAG: thioredoxin family protein [Candidatus Micrarchaeia archaeon]